MDTIKVGIGRASAKVVADNYFPVAGQDTVTLTATTKWGQQSEWTTRTSAEDDAVTEAGSLSGQMDEKTVAVAGAGTLDQVFRVTNNKSQYTVTKQLHALAVQADPYFDVECYEDELCTGEVTRVGDTVGIKVIPRYGYSRDNSVSVYLYRENETEMPWYSTNAPNLVNSEGVKFFSFAMMNTNDRGIYDVVVQMTDTESGTMFEKRINKLVTVTPRLCPVPADLTQGYEVAFTYQTMSTAGKKTLECRLWRDVKGSGLNYAEAVIPIGDTGTGGYDRLPIHNLPAGTTLVMKRDADEPDQSYAFRLMLTGGTDSNATNENGTPDWTYEAPLVITHDCETVMEWKWWYYGAVNLANNIRNVVLDGRGYHNQSIHLVPDKSRMYNSCMFLVGGTSDIELFGFDIDGSGFAGISAKSDPNPNNPHYWRANWEMQNLHIHHCTIRNCDGEGVYLGYYSDGKLTGTNSSGESVEYYAHHINGLRLYRCHFKDNGYDSVQVNNSKDVEMCYLLIEGSGLEGQGGQNYASSSTFDGRMYCCKIVRSNGNGIGCIPMSGTLEIFNNIIQASDFGGVLMASLFKSSEGTRPWQDPDGDGVAATYHLHIHNNILRGYSLGSFNTDYELPDFTFDDNLVITETGTDSVPPFFSSGEGNYFVKASRDDYHMLDLLLQIADSDNDDYRPAPDSILCFNGKMGRAAYDMDGYKNWYKTLLRIGPMMGVAKWADVVDYKVKLNGVTINGGEASTMERDVTVNLSYSGDATRYRIGEQVDLSAESWQALDGDISYTLSEGYGNKVVYSQVATDSDDEVSEVLSAGIVYSGVISFADAEVKRICVANWDSDGDGEISYSEASEVSSFGTVFKGNTAIVSFDEMQFFTGVSSINSSEFSGCTALSSVVFPDSMTAINGNAFLNCTSLTDITLPNALERLDGGFNGCTGITRLVVPDSVTYIKVGTMTALQYVDIGTGVTAMAQNAFSQCTGLVAFVMRGTTPPTYAGWTLPDAFAGTIYVPDESVDLYKAANGWKNFASKIKGLGEYVEA